MKQTLAKFREKVNVFMSGRYGDDQLNRALIFTWCAVLLISTVISFFGIDPIIIIIADIVCLSFAALVAFRFLSKNIFKRSAENDRYLKIKYNITEFFRLQSLRIKERKTHLYKKCPHCKKVMRLPRVKGKHTVRCPMCSNTYKIRIHGGAKKS